MKYGLLTRVVIEIRHLEVLILVVLKKLIAGLEKATYPLCASVSLFVKKCEIGHVISIIALLNGVLGYKKINIFSIKCFKT